jgi:uncharacterized protein (UPF0210 family)
MEIRSITCFYDPELTTGNAAPPALGKFVQAASSRFEDAGITVQTRRLALRPFPELYPDLVPDAVISKIRALEEAANAYGFAYLSVGPALPELPASYSLIPDILAATQSVFAAAVIAERQTGIHPQAIRRCAEIIQSLAVVDANGFGNLYFAALANVPAGSPFFPAAYHAGGPPAFGLALEAADLAVSAFEEAESLADARSRLIASIENHAQQLTALSQSLSKEFGLNFLGLDFTLAPFPDLQRSVGTALEHLGLPALGLHGSLAAAAFLAETLDRAQYPRTGFNGLMLPVLEDATLAGRAQEGTLAVKDLLMFSAVCGTGLDTIPLPGDTPAAALSALLLDMAALSQRLDKPLTARLLPIPGKHAGEVTQFDFPYFANSRIMHLQAQPLQGLLAMDESFSLYPRPLKPARLE